MKYRAVLGRSDLATLLVCSFFVVLNVAAFDRGGRAHAKKTLCLANLRQLGQAWLL